MIFSGTLLRNWAANSHDEQSEKPLILIIDDEEALRDGCRQVLEKCGYAVLTAEQGVEGIKLAREHMPDMAFIDLKMPNISGMEIIEILSRDIPDTVLVMITGFATIVSAVEAMQKGAYDYLPKPFNPDQLRASDKAGVRTPQPQNRNKEAERRKRTDGKELHHLCKPRNAFSACRYPAIH